MDSRCCGAYQPEPEEEETHSDMDYSNGNFETQNVCSFSSFSLFLLHNKDPKIFEWKILDEIGRGAMSRVFLAENTETNQICAVKVYNKSALSQQYLNEDPPYVHVQREVDIMTSISHEYALPIVEVIDDDYTNSLLIFAPFAPKGSLQTFIDRENPSEKTLSVCFYEIAEVLKCIHSQNIIHRDLKPENILVFSDTDFKLSDFSVSLKLDNDEQKLMDTKGSPVFLSPEECSKEYFCPKPADVWAYGVSLFYCMFKSLPFKLDSIQDKELGNAIVAVTHLLNSEELVFPEDMEYSPYLTELLNQILQKDPKKRPNFEEITKSKWFDYAREIVNK